MSTSRNDALTSISTVKNELLKVLTDTGALPPSEDIAENTLLDNLRASTRNLHTEFTDLENDIITTPPTSLLSDALENRLRAALDNHTQFNDGIYKNYVSNQANKIKEHITHNITQLNIAINAYHAFEVDTKDDPQVQQLFSKLNTLKDQLETPATLSGDKSAFTLSSGESAADLIPLITEYQAIDDANKATHKRIAVQLGAIIDKLQIPADIATLEEKLLTLGADTQTTMPGFSTYLLEAHSNLTNTKESIDELRGQLENDKRTLESPNESKIALYVRMRDMNLIDTAGQSADELIQQISDSRQIIIDAQNQIHMYNNLDKLTQTASSILEWVKTLETFNKNPIIADPLLKFEIDACINDLKNYHTELTVLDNMPRFKDKSLEEMLNDPSIVSAQNLEKACTAKINLAKDIAGLINDVTKARDNLTTFVDTLKNDNIFKTHDAFSRNLDAVIAYLSDTTLANLNKPNAGLSELKNATKDFDHFKDGSKLIDDAINESHRIIILRNRLNDALTDLENTFGKNTAAGAIKNLFTNLTSQKQTFETQLNELTQGLREALDYSFNSGLNPVDLITKAHTTYDANKDLVDALIKEVDKTLDEHEEAENQKKLEASIRSFIPKFENELDEARDEINKIKGFGQTALDEKKQCNKTLKELTNHLNEIKKALTNGTSAPSDEAWLSSIGLTEITDLKNEANKTATNEASNQTIGAAKARIAKINDDLKDIENKLNNTISYDKNTFEEKEKLHKSIAETKNKLKAFETNNIPVSAPLTDLTNIKDLVDLQTTVDDNLKKAATLNNKVQQQLTQSDVQKALFKRIDDAMNHIIKKVDLCHKMASGAALSATKQKNLSDAERAQLETDVTDIYNRLDFYKKQIGQPGAINSVDISIVNAQLHKLDEAKIYIDQFKTTQAFLAKGAGTTAWNYYSNLDDAKTALNSRLPTSSAMPGAAKATSAGGISMAVTLDNIPIQSGVLRRDHELNLTQSDGSSQLIQSSSLLHYDATTQAVKLDFFNPQTSSNDTHIDNAKEITARFGLVRIPGKDLLIEAMERLKMLRAHPNSTGGPVTIHSGMGEQQVKALLLVMKIQGIELNHNCLPWIKPKSVTDDEVTLCKKQLDKLGIKPYLYTSPEKAAEINSAYRRTLKT